MRLNQTQCPHSQSSTSDKLSVSIVPCCIPQRLSDPRNPSATEVPKVTGGLSYLACSALSFRLFALLSLSSVSCSISSIPVSEAKASLMSSASLAISSGDTESFSFFTLSAICRILSVSPNSLLRKSKMS